jgi:hypothetical protein
MSTLNFTVMGKTEIDVKNKTIRIRKNLKMVFDLFAEL